MTLGAVDPFELEIYRQRLIAITDECWATAHRTAFSPIITEALDLACEILDLRGRAVAHATRSIPSFTTALPAVTKDILARFSRDGIVDGDVFLTNDPWSCAGHLPDPALVAPVFHRGRLVAFCGVIGHASDMGGTLRRAEARDLYEEGFQIPLVRLHSAGRPDPVLVELIRANIREPEVFLGDLDAQINAAHTMRRRLAEFLEEYALADLEELSDVLQDASERAMRRAVADLPDGIYAAATELDGIGDAPLALRVEIAVRGHELEVTFPDCPPQLPFGGVNSTLSYTRSHTLYVLHCVLGPEIIANDGCYRPFTVRAPEGSILNCRRPASVGLRMLTGWHVHPLILSALSQVVPERVMAPGGTMSWAEIFGTRADGAPFHDHLVIGAGLGGTAARDGISGSSYPSSAASVPLEVIEARAPVIVERKALIPGSGGAGRMRGGLGQQVVLRPLPEAARDLHVSLSLDHRRVPAQGLFGGGPGRTASLRIRRADGRTEVVGGGYVALVGDAVAEGGVVIELSGGGGYGDPQRRDPAARERDRREGLVAD